MLKWQRYNIQSYYLYRSEPHAPAWQEKREKGCMGY